MSAFAAILITMLVVACAPLSAMAQAVACIPPPTNRTPGLPGPPDWIGTFNPPVKTGLDDPRWDGAGGFTWANGTSGDTAQFQAISSGGNLFLSWFVKLPPQGMGPENVVYVGFTQAVGATPANFAMTISLKIPPRLLRTRTLPPTIRRLIPSVRLEFPPALRVWA